MIIRSAKNILFFCSVFKLLSVTTDASCQSHVFNLNRDPLSMDSARIGVFKQRHKIGLRRSLKGEDSRPLEPEPVWAAKSLSYFAAQTLKRQLPDEEVCRLLVTPDFAKGYGPGSITMGLLDISVVCGGLALSLCRQLSAGSFPPRAFPRCLLRASHVCVQSLHESTHASGVFATVEYNFLIFIIASDSLPTVSGQTLSISLNSRSTRV